MEPASAHPTTCYRSRNPPDRSSDGRLLSRVRPRFEWRWRLLQVRQEPRRLLQAIGCAVGEMSEADRCCGFGGLFSLRLSEVSNAMTAEKLRQAAQTGAAVLVTADPGCLLQIRGLAAASGLQVEHLATVLEEATR